ncbi:MAG: hypothetical protein MZV70_51670 [Desulfobacterales bacterium]|nr:hypothetical protein [Desulfobacterales bacterium]
MSAWPGSRRRPAQPERCAVCRRVPGAAHGRQRGVALLPGRPASPGAPVKQPAASSDPDFKRLLSVPDPGERHPGRACAAGFRSASTRSARLVSALRSGDGWALLLHAHLGGAPEDLPRREQDPRCCRPRSTTPSATWSSRSNFSGDAAGRRLQGALPGGGLQRPQGAWSSCWSRSIGPTSPSTPEMFVLAAPPG